MSVEVQQRRFNTMERRPRMLRDFLSENYSSSCSSSGFKSLPRIKPSNDTHKGNSMHTLIEMQLNSMKNPPNSTFQTLMSTVKSILVKNSPSMILPRSISRKLSSSSSRPRRIRNQTFCKGGTSEIKVSTVKIKDIIRWKSFRDINVEERNSQPPLSPAPPLDFPPQSPPLDFHRCMMGSTTTTTTTTTTCNSNGSSWSDSDFTSGYLTSWEAQNDDVEGSETFSLSPLLVVGKDLVEPTTKMAGAKGMLTCQEDEHSPVSVLRVGEDEFSPFDQSLANIERKKQKFMQTFQREGFARFDLANLDQCLLLDKHSGYDEDCDDDGEAEEQHYAEERARQLLHCVKATSSLQSGKDYYLDILLLDFFSEELIGRRDQTRNNDKGCEWEILRKAKDWINGSLAYDIGQVNKDACIKDMDRRGGWSKFEKERQELALQIEMAIMHSLVAELLDLDGHKLRPYSKLSPRSLRSLG